MVGKALKTSFDLTKSVPGFAFSILKDVINLDVNFGAKDIEYPTNADTMILSKLRIMVYLLFKALPNTKGPNHVKKLIKKGENSPLIG